MGIPVGLLVGILVGVVLFILFIEINYKKCLKAKAFGAECTRKTFSRVKDPSTLIQMLEDCWLGSRELQRLGYHLPNSFYLDIRALCVRIEEVTTPEDISVVVDRLRSIGNLPCYAGVSIPDKRLISQLEKTVTKLEEVRKEKSQFEEGALVESHLASAVP